MPARKPGGKYKGKVARNKSESTIASELEAKRRRAYEENLKRLQYKRALDQLANEGLQSDADYEQEMKLAKIAQMFGTGKKGQLQKFFKNWRIGMRAVKKEKMLLERQTCWMKNCASCTEGWMSKTSHPAVAHDCKKWWTSALGRESWGAELDPAAARADRPFQINIHRLCTCCGADTGIPSLGCRAWQQLREPGFELRKTTEQDSTHRHVHVAEASHCSASKRGGSTPLLLTRRAVSPEMNPSAKSNMLQVRREAESRGHDVPEYDPSECYVLSDQQRYVEERRNWVLSLQNTAGSAFGRNPPRNHFGLKLPSLETTWAQVPDRTAKGKSLETVTHWRSGQKTMLDRHMMKMYVVGEA